MRNFSHPSCSGEGRSLGDRSPAVSNASAFAGAQVAQDGHIPFASQTSNAEATAWPHAASPGAHALTARARLAEQLSVAGAIRGSAVSDDG